MARQAGCPDGDLKADAVARSTTKHGGCSPTEASELMSRAQHTFKQGDVTRAIKATVKAGQNVQRVEIDVTTGKIVVFTGKQPKHPETEDATALIG